MISLKKKLNPVKPENIVANTVSIFGIDGVLEAMLEAIKFSKICLANNNAYFSPQN